jgi:alanine-glyoxylate transaminase / serine-glyoxylate transaminase / serine-pyruvate transaminase
MSQNSSRTAGRHFLQIPGPTPVPDRILRAMDMPVIDHRGPEFGKLGRRVLDGIKTIFKCAGPVIIYPASGTGAWEAALINTMSPGDKVLMYETGHFASLWKTMATKIGLQPEFIASDWRAGADPAKIEARLREDKAREIKAVCVVHNETSTGCVTLINEVRKAIDAAGHPALLMVDTISSLGSIDYRHDEWGVDVTVGGSQKGLMLPPGLSFNAVSDKALAASKKAQLPRSFWAWDEMIAANEKGYFPYTPATNLLQGLKVALGMLHEEGLDNVFARHDRAAEATRRAVRHWGFEIQCRNPGEYSSSLTAVRLPEGHSADGLRAEILERCNMSLGNGLGPLADAVFRIGHLGDFHDLMVTGTLTGVEIGLKARGIPHRSGGVEAAMTYLAGNTGALAAAAE